MRKLHNNASSSTLHVATFLNIDHKGKNMPGKTSNNKNFIEYSRISNFALCSIAIILVFLPSSFGETDSPDFGEVNLWNYNVEVRANYDNFWTASNPSQYIIPDNPIIRYYANNTDEIQIDYKPDRTDYWQNPDYTLEIMQGDCEDASLVMVSIHRAKGHDAIAVGGELYFDDGTVIRDMWYEYINNGTRQVKFVTPVVNMHHFTFRPMFMFNDRMSIRDYDTNWMTK